SQLARVDRIERVLDVDKRRHAAFLLRLGNHLQGDGGFTGGLRPEDLADASAGKSADSQSGVEGNGTGRDYRDGDDGVFRSKSKDGAFSELFFDLTEGQLQRSRAFFVIHVG